MRQLTSEQFLKDVSDHRMTVKMENGIYRHIRFAKLNTNNLWFDLVTWPGVLVIQGDMGTWTFSRTVDMFRFFREEGAPLSINPSYWAEKIQHGNRGQCDGTEEFDAEIFKKHLLEQLSGDFGLTGKTLEDVTAAVQSEVFIYDNEWEMKLAARDFSFNLSPKKAEPVSPRERLFATPERPKRFEFDSCELPSGKVWTYHYLWCCYAIVWGIQQWDASKAANQATEACA